MTIIAKISTLVDTDYAPGYHHVTWNGRNSRGVQVAGGLYFLRIQTSEYNKTIKMMMLK